VQRVLRTVYLPSANADALQLKVESLQAQLEEQKQFAAERFEAMKQDRELREQVWEDIVHKHTFRVVNVNVAA
jgi:coiled-coil domain-containing protein 77